MWLLLHHNDPTEEDKAYDVTDNNHYNKTSHFRNRLKDLCVPLKGKHLNKEDYNAQNVLAAIERAEKLVIDVFIALKNFKIDFV